IILGVKPRFTTPRSLVCFGGSVEIIDRMAVMYGMSSGSVITWIPYAELKVSQSRVAAATSSKRVMDQKPLPESGCWCHATGRSLRSLASAPSTSSRSQKSKLAGLISSRVRAVVGVETVLIGRLLVTGGVGATVLWYWLHSVKAPMCLIKSVTGEKADASQRVLPSGTPERRPGDQASACGIHGGRPAAIRERGA